jgi:adenylate cyclase
MDSPKSPVVTLASRRKLTAILNADVAGYSVLMRADEPATVTALKRAHEIFQRVIAEQGGRVVDTSGDSVLAEFASVVNAAQCAVALQKALSEAASTDPEEKRMRWRIGLNVGDIIADEHRIFGDGVNVAARVQSLADPGGICLSGAVYNEICDKLDLGYEFIGQHKVKNIAEPVSVYRITGLVGTRPARRLAGFHPRTSLVVALLAGAVIAGLAILFVLKPGPGDRPGPGVAAVPGQASLVVLPFTNLTNDRNQEYFSDGITNEITTELSRFPSLLVIASQAAFGYKGKNVTTQEIARELGVRYLVTGTVQRSGGRLRITAALVDTTTGLPLWTERYDRDLKDMLALQDELTQRIVRSLAVTLTDRERELLSMRRTGNVEAYDYFLRGRALYLQNTAEANRQARELFKLALSIDPGFARALAAIAITHEEDVRYQWSGDVAQSRTQAIETARKSIELDPESAFGHLVLAHVHLFVELQPDKAIQAARRAIELDPNSADSYVTLAFSLTIANKSDESIPLIRKAMRLNPHYPALYPSALGIALYFAGQPAEAVTALNDAIARNDKRISPHIILAACYARLGKQAEAQAAVTKVLALDPEFKAEKVTVTHPIRDREKMKVLMTDLRRAGLK